MNLIIDVGNTSIKFAVFDLGKLIGKIVGDIGDFDMMLAQVLKSYPKIDPQEN